MVTSFCKLNSPRPQFALEMTSDEQNLMQRHAAYWEQSRAEGHARAFGIGIVEFENRQLVEAFIANDPVVLSKSGFSYDLFLMPLGA